MKKYLIAMTALLCMAAAGNAQTTAPKKTAPSAKKETPSAMQPSTGTKANKEHVAPMTSTSKSGEAIKRKHHQGKAKKAVKTTGQ